MEKNNGDEKKKLIKERIKKLLVILLCIAVAGAYSFGGLYLVQLIMNGSITTPAWLGKSETYAENDDNGVLKDNQSISEQYRNSKNNNLNNNKDEQTAAETETETETETYTETETEQESETETKAAMEDKADRNVGYVETVEETGEPLAVVTDVTQVVKAAMPSVVAITNEYTAYDSWYGQSVDEEACGSGIIIDQNDEELLIVTNYHVVEDNNALIIKFIDDAEAEAYVKGFSEDDDLAVVSVSLDELGDDTVDSIAIAALGNSDELQVGEPAIAIGNSLGYGQSVTTGVISALNRNINEAYLIQTDAAINPGNSGGALLNIKGEVIGINSSKIADYVIEGMGYAIPISTAKPVIDELLLNETKKKVSESKRGFLGISGTDVTEDAASRYGMPEGVYVSKVIEGTGAEKAGIKKGDIITSVDNESVKQMSELQGMLEYYEAGTKVKVVVMRPSGGEYSEYTLTVTLGKREE